MSIKQRIWAGVISTILSLAVIISFALYQSNDFMMFLLKDKIHALTDSVVGVADSLNQQVVRGELSLDEAKAEFAEIVHRMHYDDGKEFFFALDYNGTFIAMGGDPAQVGQNIIGATDPETGRPMVREQIALAKAGGGFHEHFWPKAGMTTPEPKVAYVLGYQPWQMFVGTGLYLDNVNRIFYEFSLELFLVAVLLTLLVSAILLLMARSIFSRINWIREAMDDVSSGDADLTARLDESANDEFSAVAQSFNRFIAEIQSIIRAARHSSEQVQQASREMADSAQTAVATLQSQLHETELASTAINEMSTTVQEIAETANTTLRHAKDTAEQASAGKQVVEQSLASTHELNLEIGQASNSIEQLRQRSDDIGSILDVIKTIAEQTNLLALNAAIEAARAGEMGRGFAVVADEVRALAARTQASTAEIESIISYLQNASMRAHEAMQLSQERMQGTIQQSQSSGEALAQIESNTFEINDMNAQVATATDEQAVVAEEINKNVTSIFGKSQLVAGHAESILSHSEALNQVSVALAEELKKFQV